MARFVGRADLRLPLVLVLVVVSRRGRLRIVGVDTDGAGEGEGASASCFSCFSCFSRASSFFLARPLMVKKLVSDAWRFSFSGGGREEPAMVLC